jgi:hypothetical protein
VRVPDSVEENFKCDLNIKSKAHSLLISLKYDHNDRDLPVGYFDEKIEDTPSPKISPALKKSESQEKVETLNYQSSTDSSTEKS